MCQADTTLVTMLWGDNNKRPIGNFSTPHKCVRWHKLMKWVEPRSFDGFSEHFVHPKFCKNVFPLFTTVGVSGESVLNRKKKNREKTSQNEIAFFFISSSYL